MGRATTLASVCGGLVAALACAGAASGQTYISELFINPAGNDDGREAVEIFRSGSLAGYRFLVIEGEGSNAGVLDTAVDLSTYAAGSNGLLLIRDGATVLSPAPAGQTSVVVFNFNPDIENGGQTYLLGFGTVPAIGTDLDATNDGAIDAAALSGFTVVDAVSYKNAASDIDYADDYGGTSLGLFTGFTPDAIYRILNSSGSPASWVGGDVIGTDPGPYQFDPLRIFGFGGAGYPDVNTHTLDLGTPNFRLAGAASGACCYPDGSCLSQTSTDCSAGGGAYQGDNITCGAANCPQPTGACCFTNGSCQALTSAACAAAGGSYQGNGVLCGNANCPVVATGACCFLSGTCSELTSAACTSQGGSYQGDSTTCANANCPQPSGDAFISEVLVNPAGSDDGLESIELTGAPGTSLNGWFLVIIENDLNTSGSVDQKFSLDGYAIGASGVMVIRDSTFVLDPAPSAGTNVYIVNPTPDLENGGQTYVLGYGSFAPTVGTDLDANNDGSIDSLPAGFTPIDAVSYLDGTDSGVEYADDFGGVNFGSFGYDIEAIYRVLDQTANPFIWAGGDTDAGGPGQFFWNATNTFGWNLVGIADPSGEVLDLGVLNFQYTPSNAMGACCHANGSCTDGTQTDCLAAGGVYQGDNSMCSLILCPPPIGACCYPDGSCAEQTQADCMNAGGAYQGNQTLCDTANCPAPTGACCRTDGTCSIQTPVACSTSGGSYQGNSTTCESANCPLPGGQAFVSEILFNPNGNDDGFETIEITGAPGTNLNGWRLIVIENDAGSAGTLDQSISLDGMTLGANGLAIIRDSATVLDPAPAAETAVFIVNFNPDFENGGQTWVLGFGPFIPTVGTDLDSNNDGTIDIVVGNFTVRDAVSYLDGADAGFEYGEDFGGQNLGSVGYDIEALYRILNPDSSPYIWAGGDTDPGFAAGQFIWSAIRFFGWADVGVANPSFRTLDFGILNFIYMPPPAMGACCHSDGSCTVELAVNCTGFDLYQGDGTTCDQVNCPQPMGACCMADGSCDVLSAGACAGAGGLYQGDNTSCLNVFCPQPTGACCLADGSCVEVTSGDCDMQVGTYQGTGTLCSQTSCPQPTGACCLPDGACVLATAADCSGQGGTFEGVGVECNQANCPQPTGACCQDRCLCSITTESDCFNQNGIFAGVGTNCDDPTLCFPSPTCPCDWNGFDGLDSQDFFDFLDGFFTGNADYNCFDGTDSQDFFDFLECFFAPPPGC